MNYPKWYNEYIEQCRKRYGSTYSDEKEFLHDMREVLRQRYDYGLYSLEDGELLFTFGYFVNADEVQEYAEENYSKYLDDYYVDRQCGLVEFISEYELDKILEKDFEYGK